MNTKWTITDPDTNQMYRKILDEPLTLAFKEDRVIDPTTGETEVYSSVMCIDDYDWWEIVDACGTFGYTPAQVDKWLTEGEETELILECLFELES